jgi:hypothetical protein
MRVRLPLRIATSMKAGVLGKRTVTRKGGKGKVRRTVLEPRAKVAYGSKVRFAGQLVNRAGHPLAGAQVQVYSRPAEGSEQLEGAIATDDRGRFAYEVEARASHSFRFAYPGTATSLPVEDTATLLVEGDSSFTVTPKHVLNGDSVTFSGRIRGRPLPEGGKLIELQWLATGEWQTFRTVRSEPDGTWRFPYPFKRTCGVQTFRFRPHIPGEAGYGLESGNGPELAVRVRGPEC